MVFSQSWGIYIHGGSDGASHRIMYLQAAGDKRATTVAKLFLGATSIFGWPTRVRCDKGRENVCVMLLMELQNPGGVSKPVLAGRSVHNTRIERLWREVHRIIGYRFKVIFYFLERIEALDLDNRLDIWILHTIFLPVINRALRHFQETWDYHKCSSLPQERSPLREWIDGNCRRPRPGTVDPAFEVEDDFAIDPHIQPQELADQEVEEENFSTEDIAEAVDYLQGSAPDNSQWQPPLPEDVLQDGMQMFAVDPADESDTACQGAYFSLWEWVLGMLAEHEQ